MCANNTCTSAFTVPASALARGNRSTFVMAMIAIAEAFQDALAMRRAAQRSCFLGDE